MAMMWAAITMLLLLVSGFLHSSVADEYVTLVPASSDVSLDMLARDDECLAGQDGCSLNALQLRSVETQPDDDVEHVGDLDEVAIKSDPNSLRRRCPEASSGYCVVGGHMIVPHESAPGMEIVNGGNADHFDQFMNAALSHCSTPSCVLITNPVGHRTQDQFHIHFRHMNRGGHALKARLEQQLCQSQGEWQDFQLCGGGKARLFGGMPGVFSAVARAYGGGSLANIGISVWPGSCEDRTIVLATAGCSIEHSIIAG